jgi:hypothetical protein
VLTEPCLPALCGQVRIQLDGGGPIQVAKGIIAKEGFGALYKVGIASECNVEKLFFRCANVYEDVSLSDMVLLTRITRVPLALDFAIIGWAFLKDRRTYLQGLSAGLLRQATYTTARLGTFR